MSRLERKCLLASTGAHGVLVLLLCVVPLAMVSPRREIAMPVLTFIPSRLVDGLSSGGGSPLATAPPAPAAAQEQAPALAPLEPPPTKLASAPPAKAEARVAQAEPSAAPKPELRKIGEPVPSTKKLAKVEPIDGEGKPSKRKVEISLTRETGAAKPNKKSAAEARAETEANARAAQAQYADRVRSIVGAIGQNVSTGTSIDVPGPGGDAYADYGQWVVAVYHRAWTLPADIADESASVEATVVIRRDGKVESFKMTKGSGHSALDKSVERLQKVPSIAPFPEGATDERRIFVIDFKPRSKKSLP